MKWTAVLVLVVVAIAVVAKPRGHKNRGERNFKEEYSHAILEAKIGQIKEILVSSSQSWCHFGHLFPIKEMGDVSLLERE